MGDSAKIETTQLQINQALVEANGNMVAASAILGLTMPDLRDRILADPVLKKRWDGNPIPPTPQSVVSRSEDLAIAEALQQEELRMSAGLKAMGMSARSQSLALTCQQFYGANFGKIHQMTSGGIVKSFFGVLEEIEKITHQLDTKDWADEKLIAYESILREDRAKLLNFIRDTAQIANNNVLIQAKIQKMYEGAEKGKGGGGKPGFRALTKKEVEVHEAKT